jgi:uncharacterized membrane protein
MILEKIKKINQRLERYYLYLILLLATFLRLRHLAVRDFWYDEAFTGVAIKENFSDMIRMIINDVHPPLYYFTLKVFATFFGYGVFGIRLYSTVFGVLAVFATYLFAKELFNRKSALFASFLATIAPFAIQYSMEARMYSMLVFLLLVSAYFFLKALKTDATKNYIWWGIFLGLACLTHYMGIIFCATFYFAYVAWNIFDEQGRSKKINAVAWKSFVPNRAMLAGFFAALLIFSFWLKRFYYHLIDLGDNLSWVKPASFSDIFSNVQMFFLGTPVGEMSSGMPSPNDVEGISRGSVLIFLTIFLAMIVFDLLRKEKKKTAIVLVFSFGFIGSVYILSLLGKHYFVARYLLPGAYFIFILVGAWLAQAKFYLKFSTLTLYFAALFFAVHLGFSTGWNVLAKNTDKYAKNDYYIFTAFDYVIAKYYLDEEHLRLYNIDWPSYDPSYWAAISSELKRVESFSVVANDPRALILSNVPLDKKTSMDPTFDSRRLMLVERYNNIWVYRILQ